MTEKPEANEEKDKEIAAAAATDKAEDAKLATETAPKSRAAAKAQPTGKTSNGGRALNLLILVLVLLALAGGGYYFWQQSLGQEQMLAAVTSQVESQQQQISQLEQTLADARKQQLDQHADDQELLTAINRRLDSHNKRLLSMSSTSRDDWLLAEAEYLLRLANQRLLMERGTRGAQALLEATDNILRDLDDVDLFPVRKALARDLAALKLAGQIDREDLYLRLAVLAEQVETLEVLAPEQVTPAVIRESAEMPAAEPLDLWSRFRKSLSGALQKLGDYVRIRRHSEPVEPLLAPRDQLYLSQNLRLMLERAQLAMLREEQEIYRHSLDQAQRWLRTYYGMNEKSPVLQQTLAELKREQVSQELPSISGSLAQLKAYIEQLHKLGSEPDKSEPAQSRVEQTTTANNAQASTDREK